MQKNPTSALLSEVPDLVWVSIGLFLLLLCAGWLVSTILGVGSAATRRMRLFIAFPLTHPFALIIFLWKDWRAALPGILCHVLAFVALFGGGALARSIEQGRLNSQVAAIRASGGSLSVGEIFQEPVPGESNIWMHPFLKPLAMAAQRTEDENPVIENESYQRLSLPRAGGLGIEYARKSDHVLPTASPLGDPFFEFHQSVLAIIKNRDGVIHEANTPQSWEACGEVVIDHFGDGANDFVQLREALERPFNRYPHAWEDGHAMLLPHLHWMKWFCESAGVLTQSHVVLGQSEKAFEYVRLAMQLTGTSDTDLLIARLVQMSQLRGVLNAVRVAQQCHAWNDAQWQEVDAWLAGLDFPMVLPDSLRTERMILGATIEPMFEMGPLEMVDFIERLGDVSGAKWRSTGSSGPVRFLLDVLFRSHAQAMLAKDWRLCLEGFDEMIDGVEQALERTRTGSWANCRPPPLSRDLMGYGLLGGMMLPAFESIVPRGIQTQLFIRLARVAIAAERYYLARGYYPDSIRELQPDYFNGTLRDPMNDQPWHYTPRGDFGFTLYSVGMNGVDDGGVYLQSHGIERTKADKDDIAWTVHIEPPALPEFGYTTR